MGWSRSFWARPPSRWATVTTWTRAIKEKISEIIGNHDGIWDCTFVGECSVVCPKHVDPAAAIQRLKVDTTKNWFQSILMPWGQR